MEIERKTCCVKMYRKMLMYQKEGKRLENPDNIAAKNVTGSPALDTFYLAYDTLAGNRILFETRFCG